ncbi:MAG: hypothetical protein ACJAQ2_000827 [Vicingaceae bacterium]|jgi:hypothetical protein
MSILSSLLLPDNLDGIGFSINHITSSLLARHKKALFTLSAVEVDKGI